MGEVFSLIPEKKKKCGRQWDVRELDYCSLELQSRGKIIKVVGWGLLSLCLPEAHPCTAADGTVTRDMYVATIFSDVGGVSPLKTVISDPPAEEGKKETRSH